jgi:hypothetical protein
MGAAHSASQEVMHELPGTILAPLAEVIIDAPPGRQIMGQHPPGTAAAEQREDAVQDLALGICLRSPTRFGLGDEMVDHRPCFIAEIGRIRLSWIHALQDNQSRPAQTNFLDTL